MAALSISNSFMIPLSDDLFEPALDRDASQRLTVAQMSVG